MKWVHRFSVFLSASTLFLIFVGGMVTSTDSGLAVPDWPLSYGRLMPPMIGGIFYEHGHRIVATIVGFLTVVMAIMISLQERRAWIKKAAWAAVGLVILQGVLGGLTVLFQLPKPISIAHACLAQTFLCSVVALAVWTSPSWENLSHRFAISKNSPPFHHLAGGLFATIYFQLILGAILRHTGWVLVLHIASALVILVLSGFLFKVSRENMPAPLPLFARLLFFLSIAQILLGVITYFIIGHEFFIIPTPLFPLIVVTLHVTLGALLLALAAINLMFSFKMKPANIPPLKRKLSDYFQLTKPGISFMAGTTALAGFVLGSKGQTDFFKLFHTGVGTLLIAGGAGTLNMLIERDSDARMKRTQQRPLPAGRLEPGEVLFFGSLLSGFALIYLALTVNALTALVAGLTLSIYLYIYTPLKKVTALCTMAGAVAGALPPVIGWTAATGALGIEGWILFGIIFFWQFPHFFSLAWLYKDDYERGGFHMLPKPTDNGTTTAFGMIFSSLFLLIVSLLPTPMGLTGFIYLAAAIGLGSWQLWTTLRFYFDRSTYWARQIFFSSLAYVPLLFIVMVLNKSAF